MRRGVHRPTRSPAPPWSSYRKESGESVLTQRPVRQCVEQLLPSLPKAGNNPDALDGRVAEPAMTDTNNGMLLRSKKDGHDNMDEFQKPRLSKEARQSTHCTIPFVIHSSKEKADQSGLGRGPGLEGVVDCKGAGGNLGR